MNSPVSLCAARLEKDKAMLYAELTKFFVTTEFQRIAWHLESLTRVHASTLEFTCEQAGAIVSNISHHFKITPSELEQFMYFNFISLFPVTAPAKAIYPIFKDEKLDEITLSLMAASQKGLLENRDALRIICIIIFYYPDAKKSLYGRRR